MSTLSLANVVTISVSQPPAGIAAFKVNNLAIFTKETPVNGAITAAAPGIYLSPSDVADDWGSGSEVAALANLIFSQSPNILNGDGSLIIVPMAGGDTLNAMIPATLGVVFFAGALYAGYAPNDAELEAAATACEANRVKLFVSSHLTASLTPVSGVLAVIAGMSTPHAIKILYTRGATALNARAAAAAFAGRAMSVDFEGSNTAATMHLKDLAGIQPDPGITQSVLDTCATLGVSAYSSIAGVPKVFNFGPTSTNDFFDNVYNLDWLVFALRVAGFNCLATVGTKVKQTEDGIAILRDAYIKVLQQAVRNGFVAPGAWNSAELFGNPADLQRNVGQIGYYVYHTPVNLQSQASRAARRAPLIQIAIKFAGAVHSTSVVVSVNP
jgi:hypothetical protein